MKLKCKQYCVMNFALNTSMYLKTGNNFIRLKYHTTCTLNKNMQISKVYLKPYNLLFEVGPNRAPL